MKATNEKKAEGYSSPYNFEGRIPLSQAIPLGLQHVMAMFIGNLTPLIIVMGVCGLTADAGFGELRTALLQNAMIIAGVVTLVQMFSIGPVGGKVPIVMGTSSGFLGVLNNTVAACGGGILAYGGVSVYVVSFAVFPIALEVFHEADLPRNYIPAALCFGCSTFAMVAPGAPQIQNAIPSSAVGEDLMAGMVVGFISCGVILVVGCFALMRMVAAQKAKGASFIAKPMDVFSDEDTKLPHPLVAFIPLIVTIILINVKINGQVICQLETGVLAGSVLALIMMWKYQDPSKLLGHVGDTCKSSLNAICNTSAVVAFGGVVKLAPAFAAVVNAMLNIPGPKILSLAIATTVLAGICGSASGGCGIASPLLGPAFVNMGIPAGVVARTISISSAALDSLPHNGYIVTVCNGLCNETHKDCYKPVFVVTVLVPFIGTLVAVALFSMFPNLP